MEDSVSRSAWPEPSRKRLVGLLLGPLLFGIALAVPLPALTPQAHRLAAVFVWTVTYWVTEAVPVPVTAMLSSVLAVVLGIASARKVLAPYADPVIFLFIGSFIMAEAMRASGLDRRIALSLLRRSWATSSPGRVLAAVGAVTWAISSWVSNTATTAMMLPIGLGLLAALGPRGDPERSHYPTGLLLMLTWASSVAVGIPIASPPNLIAIAMIRDLTTSRLTFFDWVAVTMPLAVLMLGLAWLLLRFRYGNSHGAVGDLHSYMNAHPLGPWSRAELNVLCVFVLAVFLWMLPGAVAMVLGSETPLVQFFEAHAPESVVALLAAALLFVLPTDVARGEFTLSWKQAAHIDWGTILLFGGGLSLGTLIFDTKLAEVAGTAILRISGAQSLWALTAVAIALGVLLSETSSNTASASIVIPTAIAVALGAGVSPIPPAVGAALGASFGFMLPVSTPPNAIIYGTGLVPMREMIRSGIWLDVAGAVLIWVGLRLLCPLLGVL